MPSAAWTARRGVVLVGDGRAEQRHDRRRPVYWLIVPSKRCTSAVISSKQRSMIRCTSSGSRRSASVVKPDDVDEEHGHLPPLALERGARREDLLGEVLGRVGGEPRRAPVPERRQRTAGQPAAGGGRRVRPRPPRDARTRGRTSRPPAAPSRTAGTTAASRAPHSRQNFARSGFSWRHAAQSITCSSRRPSARAWSRTSRTARPFSARSAAPRRTRA